MATIVFLQTDRWCLLNCAGNLLAMQSALEGLAFLAGFSPICLSTHFQLLRALLCYLQSICDGNFFFTVYLSVVRNDSSLSVGSHQTQPSSRRAAHSISQQNYWPQTIISLLLLVQCASFSVQSMTLWICHILKSLGMRSIIQLTWKDRPWFSYEILYYISTHCSINLPLKRHFSMGTIALWICLLRNKEALYQYL